MSRTVEAGCGKPRITFRQKSEGKKLARLAHDIDDTMYDLDPYGYMDACDQVGLGYDQMRSSTRASIRLQLREKDRSLLDGLYNVRKDFEDDPDEKKNLKKLNNLIGRTKKVLGVR